RVEVTVESAPPGLQQHSAPEWFSPGLYMDLNESEKLNNPAMQSLAAGKGFSAALEAAPGLVPADANKINVIKLPRRVRRFWALPGADLLKLSAAHAATLG